VALLALLFSFIIAVDVVLNLDRFIDAADKVLAKSDQGEAGGVRRALVTVLLIFNLWWPKLLQLFNYVVGMALVGAMGFTLTQMVRNREVVAILAGGISLHRVARPILIVAVIAMGLKTVNQEFILPRIAPLLMRDAGDAARTGFDKFPVLPVPDGSGRLLYADEFEPATGTLRGVRIWERDSSGRPQRRIEAATAVYRPGEAQPAPATSGAPAADATGGWWELEGATVQALALGESGNRSAPAPTPAGQGGTMRLRTDLDPTALLLKRYEQFASNLSWSQISRMLRSDRLSPGLRETLQRVQWGRVSTALSTLLTIVITMPFFLTREPRNMLVQSLKCAPVGLGTLIGGTIGSLTPVPGLPIALGVMLPVLVLIPVGIAMVFSLRT
jgi:lipopolysaccharide export system permease protein